MFLSLYSKLITMVIRKKIKKREYTRLEVLQLAIAFEKSTQTINRWISDNNDILTSDKAKDALSNKK